MQRKLASVQVITAIDPIDGADRIQRATVLGWSVVVGRDEFAPGDRCVFFEIDSVLPCGMPWAQFMAPRNYRVKSVKLKGVLSQGLALPIKILPGDHEQYHVGDDVTATLGVSKYEPPVTGPETAGPFPGDVPKTDEIRLQSIPGIIDEIKVAPFYATVKLDGMSGTFIKRPDGLQVCSRNFMLKESDSAHWRVARRYDLENKLPIDYAIQGEVCGPGIQRNRLNLSIVDLFVFNVFDIKLGRYLNWDDAVLFCHRLGLKTVPIDFEIDKDELASFPFTMANFLQLADGTYAGTQNRREGIVIRPLQERSSAVLGGDRLSFKVISNAFLLKDEE